MSTETATPLTRPWTPAELRGWQNARRADEVGTVRAAAMHYWSAAADRSRDQQAARRRRDITMLAATVASAITSAIAAIPGISELL